MKDNDLIACRTRSASSTSNHRTYVSTRVRLFAIVTSGIFSSSFLVSFLSLLPVFFLFFFSLSSSENDKLQVINRTIIISSSNSSLGKLNDEGKKISSFQHDHCCLWTFRQVLCS